MHTSDLIRLIFVAGYAQVSVEYTQFGRPGCSAVGGAASSVFVAPLCSRLNVCDGRLPCFFGCGQEGKLCLPFDPL